MGKEYAFKFDEKKLAYSLTFKDIVDVLEIIDNFPCGELYLELGDLKMKVIKKEKDDTPIAVRPEEVGQSGSPLSMDKTESELNESKKNSSK